MFGMRYDGRMAVKGLIRRPAILGEAKISRIDVRLI